MNRFLLLFALLILPIIAYPQIGGNSAYSFLDLSSSARATGVGGKYFAGPRGDIALSIDNPSLLNQEVHQHIAFNTGFYLAGTNFGTMVYGHHSQKLNTTFSTSANYITSGKLDGRDEAGNPIGDFRVGNFYLSGAAARQWKNFTYGVQLKFIFSSIEQYKSLGLAADFSASYFKDDKDLVLSMILRNIGTELKAYYKEQDREKLPTDLAFALSKKFEKIPLRLNIVAHHLYEWDITRPKAKKNQQLIIGTNSMTERGFIDKIFAHLVAGVEVDVAKPIQLRIGYDHLRRMELGGEEKKGLVGLSAGIGVNIQQFRIDYSLAKYHSKGTLNQIGIAVNIADWGNQIN
ncbi:MAG: type IX secretion system protein PorQ [Chitinophagales bacterium]|nr:type IX secretion system protein PorQ [Chitinophagales bacterium]